MGMYNPSETKRAWGPFTGRQLTTIACVAIVSIVVIVPTAALAATGSFTSTTASPAVKAVNLSTATNAVGAVGVANATGNAARTGVAGGATGANGVGVKGSGVKYGVFSNGPLGVSGTNRLKCTGCVIPSDLAGRQVLNFNLAAGTNSTAITIPASTPVEVVGVVLTFNFRGVASATLLRIPNQFLEWTGLESTAGSAITQGFSGTPGTHILYLDFSHEVDVQVNNANSIRIHNGSSAQRAGKLVIIAA